MADQPVDKSQLPDMVAQNPSLTTQDSQDRKNAVRTQVDRIMAVFLKVLPSNYVARVTGPAYSIQFQAAAEQIAAFQIDAQEIFADNNIAYTRPEYLFQIIGALIFPDANASGWPEIPGDLSYRTFLGRMVQLLLQGGTKKTMEEGVELLTDADVEIIERAVAARMLEGGRSAWGWPDQHVFEINVSESDGEALVPFPGTTDEEGGLLVDRQRFPEKPFRFLNNVELVLRALKPGHTLYDLRFLFTEIFDGLFSDSSTLGFSIYYYQDFRRFWWGAERIAGDGGITPTDRTLLSDPTRDFSSIKLGCILTILSGPNSVHSGGVEGTPASVDEGHVGRFRVMEILVFPGGDDAVRRAYTTSPTGLSGRAEVRGEDIFDVDQTAWDTVVEGEILTFSEGLNAGSYRLKTLLGNRGGLIGPAILPTGVGTAVIPGVRAAPSTLRLRRRVAVAATGQEYEVTVDRLGMQVPRVVTGEDASRFFYR